MTARVRRSTPCPHHPDVRDCGDCVAAAHRRAIAAAEVRVHAAPDQCAEVFASMAMGDAEAALDGFNVLRENGIPLAVTTAWPHLCPSCGVRSGYVPGRFAVLGAGICPNSRCPGRRVRCQLPEVRR